MHRTGYVSHFGSQPRQTVAFPPTAIHWREYAPYMKRHIPYTLVAAAVVVAALFAFLPPARHFIWLGIFWGIVTVSVIAVVSVIVNIVSVMFSMYNGYSPTDEAERPAEAPREALRFFPSDAPGDLILQQRLD